MRIIAVLILLFMTGCGRSHPNSQVIRFGNGHAVAMTTSMASSIHAKDQLRIAAEYTVRCWENFNRRSLPPTLIIVSEGKILSDGILVTGAWRGGAAVEVWAGEENEMPALFHEFCHRAYFLYDHQDFRWPYWDAAGNQCYKAIADSRN